MDYMQVTNLNGYTGCLRGLSVGGHLIDLTSKGADGIARGKTKSLFYTRYNSVNL